MTVTTTDLARRVARQRGIPAEKMLGCCREHEACRPRFAVMFVMRRKAKLPYSEIGCAFAGKGKLGTLDHTGALHGVRKFEQLLQRRCPETISLYRTAIRSWLLLKADASPRSTTEEAPDAYRPQPAKRGCADEARHPYAPALPVAVPDVWRHPHGQDALAA